MGGATHRSIGRAPWAALLAVMLVPLILPATGSARGVHLRAVSQAAADFKGDGHRQLSRIFRHALLVSLTDSSYTGDGTVYVGTGDINSEWLRDSSAQVRPYLYFAGDPAVSGFIKAVIARQETYIQRNSRANAFSRSYRVMKRKYELDSLCYPVLLAWSYWKVTGDDSVFTHRLQGELRDVLNTLRVEQHHTSLSRYKSPLLPGGGRGRPVGFTGMIWSGFRPSDDPSTYNYPIPGEMMTVQALAALAEMERAGYADDSTAAAAETMRQQVNAGVQRFGIVSTKRWGKVYAYEVDGLGHAKLMDDANVPSLLSAPYLGYGTASEPVYTDTRRMILSRRGNPYYYRGRVAAGIGSPHTPRGYIWPLALVTQALTSTSPTEVAHLVHEIVDSDPGDHLLHESFNRNNRKVFTRRRFDWPNSLFAELILSRYLGMPQLPTPSTADLPML